MATLLALYSVEASVEPAVVTVVTTELAAVTGLQVCRSRQDVSKVTPRVEVLLTLGAKTGGRRASSGAMELMEWLGTLTFSVVTNRKKNGSSHDDILGRLRVMCLYGQNKFASTPTNHAILKMEDAGTTHSVDEASDEQVTDLSFDVRIGIRHSVWP